MYRRSSRLVISSASGLSGSSSLKIRELGITRYEDTLRLMREFTDARDSETPDEFWLLQHEKVFTQGQAGKDKHVLDPGDIPIVRSDRGGQVTYHGPGQLICYLLLDIKRKQLGIRSLVSGIEQSVIRLLASYEVKASTKEGAPGVYVGGAKVAALGLRVRRARSYHGLSLNVAMDLEPFKRINPCGYEGLAVTDLTSLGVDEDISAVSTGLVEQLADYFGYDSITRHGD
ncbi:MAG: octanoyltransferase [Gammaproteobacteria bacterium]|nr:octanoyltransferase [Gammaproteobacteria bacterium]